MPDRGKVLSAEEIEELKSFSRYLDVDGDGVPYRTLPGVHPKGAYFTRGSGHDKHGKYTEDSDAYLEVVDRIAAEDPVGGGPRARSPRSTLPRGTPAAASSPSAGRTGP